MSISKFELIFSKLRYDLCKISVFIFKIKFLVYGLCIFVFGKYSKDMCVYFLLIVCLVFYGNYVF